MLDWITENSLALYGAVVGTVALLINFVRLRHQQQSNQTRLSVSVERSKGYDENIKRLQEPLEDDVYNDGPHLLSVYIVTIRNLGNVEAHIESCGIVTSADERKEALIPYGGGEMSNLLRKVSEAQNVSIPAKSAQRFKVYLRRNEDPFEVRRAFAVEKTGRAWKSKRFKQ